MVKRDRPHFVSIEGGNVKCDSNCPQWRGSRLCSHVVAVAHQENCLAEFISKYKKSKKEANITKMIIEPTQKRAAGSKSGQPGRSRKGKGKAPTQLHD